MYKTNKIKIKSLEPRRSGGLVGKVPSPKASSVADVSGMALEDICHGKIVLSEELAVSISAKVAHYEKRNYRQEVGLSQREEFRWLNHE